MLMHFDRAVVSGRNLPLLMRRRRFEATELASCFRMRCFTPSGVVDCADGMLMVRSDISGVLKRMTRSTGVAIAGFVMMLIEPCA